MYDRISWRRRLLDAWERKNVLWLTGVRRVGKTTLCQSLPEIEYFDCELPRVRREMEDPEAFLKRLRGKRVVLDEVHRLSNPSELLKIAADHFSSTRVVATGSSTLGASARFRDTLAGRKEEIWLTPLSAADLVDFGRPDLDHRLLRGGLPPFFLAEELPEVDFQEWLDAYWAKDILELFRLERRSSFQRFFELLLAQSGGIFEATGFSRACEVSRTTISNYLAVFEATHVAHVLRPFSESGAASEIVAAPKVYGFDSGFVCYYKGWAALRSEDRGLLWEHYVLNEVHTHLPRRSVHYWRNKRGQEVDLVVPRRGRPPLAIECKASANDFDPRNLGAFRQLYPDSALRVVAIDVERSFEKTFGEFTVGFRGLAGLIEELVAASGRQPVGKT